MGNNKKAPLEYWARLFHDDIHYNMPVLETLGELETKLKEILFYLQKLDVTTATQGIIIAKIGLTYAAKFLEIYFNMDDSFPDIINLDQAISYLENTINQIKRISTEWRYFKRPKNPESHEPFGFDEETATANSGNIEELEIKRTIHSSTHIISTVNGEISFDNIKKSISFKNNTIIFPSEKNYRLLKCLCKNGEEPVSFKDILTYVWGTDPNQPIEPTDKENLTRTKCHLCKFLKDKNFKWIEIVCKYRGTYQMKFNRIKG